MPFLYYDGYPCLSLHSPQIHFYGTVSGYYSIPSSLGGRSIISFWVFLLSGDYLAFFPSDLKRSYLSFGIIAIKWPSCQGPSNRIFHGSGKELGSWANVSNGFVSFGLYNSIVYSKHSAAKRISSNSLTTPWLYILFTILS